MGGILAVAAVMPELCVRLLAAVSAGQHEEARQLQKRIAPIGRMVTSGYGVPGLKAALDLAGFKGGEPRAPLASATREAQDQIRAETGAVWRRSYEGAGTSVIGPGPSPVSSRVMQAMGAPVLSHLDPAMIALLDDVRARLGAAFRAGDDAFSLAVSGTVRRAMEAAVANLTKPGARALVVVTGYFGDRLAQMLERYGATVSRLQVEWGRACDPAQVERALATEPADIVGDGSRRNLHRRRQSD